MEWGQAFLQGMEMGQRRKLALMELEQRKQEAAAMQQMRMAEENRRAQEFEQQQADRLQTAQAMKALEQRAMIQEMLNRKGSANAFRAASVNPAMGFAGAAAAQAAPPQPEFASAQSYGQAFPSILPMLPPEQALKSTTDWQKSEGSLEKNYMANVLRQQALDIRRQEAASNQIGKETGKEALELRRRIASVNNAAKNITISMDPRFAKLAAAYQSEMITDEEFNTGIEEIEKGDTKEPEKKPGLWKRIFGGSESAPGPTPVSAPSVIGRYDGKKLK